MRQPHHPHSHFVTTDYKCARTDNVNRPSRRPDLAAQDGNLTAAISDVQINGKAANPGYVSVWNQRLANRLQNAGRRNPDSTLQSVTFTGDAVEFVWRIETARSTGGVRGMKSPPLRRGWGVSQRECVLMLS